MTDNPIVDPGADVARAQQHAQEIKAGLIGYAAARDAWDLFCDNREFEDLGHESLEAWWRAEEMFQVRIFIETLPFLAWKFFAEGVESDGVQFLLKGSLLKLVKLWYDEFLDGVKPEKAARKVPSKPPAVTDPDAKQWEHFFVTTEAEEGKSFIQAAGSRENVQDRMLALYRDYFRQRADGVEE